MRKSKQIVAPEIVGPQVLVYIEKLETRVAHYEKRDRDMRRFKKAAASRTLDVQEPDRG